MRLNNILIIVFVFLAGSSTSTISQDGAPFVSDCKTDAEISEPTRNSVNRAALEFVQRALGPDSALAYSSMTDDARKEVSGETFANSIQQLVKLGPFSDLHVTHTYVANIVGGNEPRPVVCGTLSRAQDWVAVTIRPGPAQAHVVVEASTVNNSWAFVLWLWFERENWHVEYLQFTMDKVVGKSADDFQALAENERRVQHSFNAYIPYAAALQLSYWGPHFQLGVRPEIQNAANELKAPRELWGRPPFVWELGKSKFTVLRVSPLGVGGKIYLELDHEIDAWTDNEEAEMKNYELIAGFGQAYPEYKSAFAGLVARAHERGGTRVFGTVDENQH
jgi:hypothetical protein